MAWNQDYKCTWFLGNPKGQTFTQMEYVNAKADRENKQNIIILRC